VSAGFYKWENPILLFGRVVLDANYELRSEMKDEYGYPVDGWYWFDDEDQAKQFFGVPSVGDVG
jgi:hypothetical protein